MLLKCTWKQDASPPKRLEQIILFSFMKADNTQSTAKYEMLIFLFSFIKSKSLIMLMPSQISHREITPTFNAVRCIVKKQQIISMFHFWMS